MTNIQECLLIVTSFIGCLGDDDDHSEIDLPTSIEYINSNYPSSKIHEAELEERCNGDEVYEVELESDSEEELELVFDLEGTFLFSKVEISLNELPDAIILELNTTYEDHELEEAERLIMANDGNLYIIELENDETELEVLADDNGDVICEQISDDD